MTSIERKLRRIGEIVLALDGLVFVAGVVSKVFGLDLGISGLYNLLFSLQNGNVALMSIVAFFEGLGAYSVLKRHVKF